MMSAAIKRQYSSMLPLLCHCLPVFHKMCKLWNGNGFCIFIVRITLIKIANTVKLRTEARSCKNTGSPEAGPITLHGLLTIVSLLFSIVLSVSMKFSPGGRSPPAWLSQNPRWPPRWSHFGV